MLPTPSSSPHTIFADRLNTIITPPKQHKAYLPTPPEDGTVSRKRLAKKHAQENNRKRVKTWTSADKEVEDESSDEDQNLFDKSDDDLQTPDRATHPSLGRRRQTAHYALSALTSTPTHLYGRLALSTRPILQSFVSSLKTDIFNCPGQNTDSGSEPLYDCSYSHSAKRGGVPLLAVATERGSVQILDTSKRALWDPEPVRTILQPHDNAIFEVNWDRTDTRIVTCSADHSSRITSVESHTVTHALLGHKGTVKTAVWDPTNDALLATGGRDGIICLWDLRTSTTRSKEGIPVLNPVIAIPSAHGNSSTLRTRKKKARASSVPRGVTGLIYPEGEPHGLISSGASNGILRFWDLRKPEMPRRSRSTKPKRPPMLYSSPRDPTILHGSRRPRGIISLAQGSGPTAGIVFGMGHDSRIHTYTLQNLAAQPTNFAHEGMCVGSFDPALALSPCGRWLACSATSPKSTSFLFDVSGAGRLGGVMRTQPAVELQGQEGIVGAVDWADGILATCVKESVQLWRPDVEVYRQCRADPGEARWNWYCSKEIA